MMMRKGSSCWPMSISAASAGPSIALVLLAFFCGGWSSGTLIGRASQSVSEPVPAAVTAQRTEVETAITSWSRDAELRRMIELQEALEELRSWQLKFGLSLGLLVVVVVALCVLAVWCCWRPRTSAPTLRKAKSKGEGRGRARGRCLPVKQLRAERTADWLVNEVAKSGIGNVTSPSNRWSRESGVDGGARSVHVHKLLSKVLQLGICNDGLNIRNLVSFEYLMRRLQLIEEVHREDPRNPSWEGAEFYLGSAEAKGGALLAPSLRKHVSDQLGREAAIMKEKRKAREARKGGGGGKNAPAKDA